VAASSASEPGRWTIHRGCTRPGISGREASSLGSPSPKAMRSSKDNRPSKPWPTVHRTRWA
jgi:hypothetical protein